MKKCDQVGIFKIEFPENNNDSKCTVEFDFGDTTFRVFAYPTSCPENSQQLIANYEFDSVQKL